MDIFLYINIEERIEKYIDDKYTGFLKMGFYIHDILNRNYYLIILRFNEIKIN